jgi:hypothetical protein
MGKAVSGRWMSRQITKDGAFGLLFSEFRKKGEHPCRVDPSLL